MTVKEDIAFVAPARPRRVVMLTFDGASSLDTVGPVDVLAGTQVALQSHNPVYAIDVVSLDGGLVRTSPAGLKIDTIALADLPGEPIDILLVAGGETAPEVARGDPRIRAAVRDLADRSGCVASICTGAFLLAAAGLLDDRKATTHWKWSEQLKHDYPAIDADADKTRSIIPP